MSDGSADAVENSRPQSDNPADLVSFGHLELVAQQLVEGLLMGRHRSPFKGSSVEFVEHREYYPGDELRHVDWRAYGKTGRYYVKEFEDETNLKATLLVDCSASMKYAGHSVSKFDYARLMAASLTWLLLSQRDSVGLVTFDSAVRVQMRPSGRRETFRQLVEALQQTEPGDETSIATVVESLLPSLGRRSLVILISDCLDDLDDLRTTFQRIRHARHDLVVFRIVAPEEETFPFERPTQFRNLEDTGHRLLVDPARLQREYLKQYQQFSQRLEHECGSLGIDYRRILTSEPLRTSLGNWLAERNARAGQRR
ncbi:MAG: DUF58 domain-containing protein [Planctomycetaceae bacterium]|nr:DUF58 domain-containing protein [Planctomycetaceae bacterium]